MNSFDVIRLKIMTQMYLFRGIVNILNFLFAYDANRHIYQHTMKRNCYGTEVWYQDVVFSLFLTLLHAIFAYFATATNINSDDVTCFDTMTWLRYRCDKIIMVYIIQKIIHRKTCVQHMQRCDSVEVRYTTDNFTRECLTLFKPLQLPAYHRVSYQQRKH